MPRMKYERIGETIWKKSNPKNRKKIKIKAQLPHVKKTTSKKANFCSNTVFILYFKIRVKKFHAAKPLANHDSNLT